MKIKYIWIVMAWMVFCGTSVSAGTTYHLAANGNDGNDGTTRETAKATFEAAMACLTGQGDVLIVHDGAYTNTSELVIKNNCTVMSENGAEKTHIVIPSEQNLFTFNGSGTVRGFTIAPSAERVKCNVVRMFSAGLFADCVVRDLGMTTGGYVAHQGNGDAIISNCCFYGCQGGGRNGAVVHQWTSGKVYDCKFVGCSGDSSEFGGTVMLFNGCIRNSLIASCTNTKMGAGVSFYDSAAYAENCTVVDCHCSSDTYAGGMSVRNGSPNVVNCIVTGCSNKNGEANMSGSFGSVTYTATHPLQSGVGNIDLRVVDYANPEENDYRVMSGPTINAGRSASWMNSAYDLAGTNRILQGVVDMGCYESSPSGIKASIQAQTLSKVGEGPVTLKAIVTAADAGALTYAWAVTNRFSGAEMLRCEGEEYETVTVDCTVGEYDVALVVSKDLGESTKCFEKSLFQVKPAVIWVTKDGSTTYPYDTGARAFRSLNEAIAFVDDGMTVKIGDGVYTNDAPVMLSREVTVCSENGRDAVTIVSGGNFWQWQLSHDRAKVDGLTMNGSFAEGHAVSLDGGRLDNCTISNFNSEVLIRFDKNNLVSNCTITCCRVYGRNAMASGNGNGQFRDCAFVDNEFCAEAYGGISNGYHANPVFRNCLMARNCFKPDVSITMFGFVLTMDGGVLENCTIVSNRCICGTEGLTAVTHTAGVIRNCIIAFNVSKVGPADLSTTAPASISHTLVTTEGAVDGCDGCFVEDPKFKHLSRGDYRLKGCSPAIDKAVWQDWMENATDISGGPRLLGKTVDLGCYECPRTGLILLIQ